MNITTPTSCKLCALCTTHITLKCILNADLCLESVFPFVQHIHSKVFDEVSAQCFVPIFILIFFI